MRFQSKCAGGCGATIEYAVHNDGGGAPEVSAPFGALAFRGGHLCIECADIVLVALDVRRPARATLEEKRAAARVLLPRSDAEELGISTIRCVHCGETKFSTSQAAARCSKLSGKEQNVPCEGEVRRHDIGGRS
jgi:hypothetical protein